MSMQDSSDETVENAAICFGDCIKYYQLEEIPFQISFLIDLLISRPKLQNAILYILETLSISNPKLFPNDKYILTNQEILNNHFASLFISFLSIYTTRSTILNFNNLLNLKDHELSLLLACATLKGIFIEGADMIAQSPENEENRAIACANCIVSGKCSLPRKVYVHYSSKFFASSQDLINPISGGKTNNYFPESFLEWGSSYFSTTNRGKLINKTIKYSIQQPEEIFNVSYDQSHKDLIEINKRAKDLMHSNDLIKARYNALKDEHNKLIKDYSKLEIELIESRCQQMKKYEEI